MTPARRSRLPSLLPRLGCLFVAALLPCASAAAAPAESPESMGFTAPAVPWVIYLPVGGLRVIRQEGKPDGRSAYFELAGSDASNGFRVSFFIEPANHCHDSEECRDTIWRGLRPHLEDPEDISLSAIDGIGVVEFLLPRIQGREVRQRNLYAEYVVDGYWIDLHITKDSYKSEDRALILGWLKGLAFVPKSTPAPTPRGI